MLLFAETTTFSTIADYATSLPEPVELLVFGTVLATVAFLLRSTPARSVRPNGEEEATEKA